MGRINSHSPFGPASSVFDEVIDPDDIKLNLDNT
jgi:hypothetical protein